MASRQSISFTDEETKEVKVYTFPEDDSKEEEKATVSLWRQDLKRPWQIAHRSAIELLGTALITWFASSSCADFPDNSSIVQTSLKMAFIYATLIQALSFPGGCHFNPMITIIFAVLGKISWVRIMAYTNAQYVGAVLGSYMYKLTTPEDLQGFALCSNRLNEDVGLTWWQGLLIEGIVTAPMTLAVLTVTDERGRIRPGGPLIIGLAYGAGYLVAMPYTGASMNPARSIGPAILAKYWIYNWVFGLGPQIGIKLAALVYWLINKPAPKIQPDDKSSYKPAQADEQL